MPPEKPDRGGGDPSRSVPATNFGKTCHSDGQSWASDHTDYVQPACEARLKRLGTDCIDLCLIHRVNRTVPIENTVGIMANLKAKGTIRHLCLSKAATVAEIADWTKMTAGKSTRASIGRKITLSDSLS